MNPDFVAKLETAGVHFVGTDEQMVRMEILERRDHPFFFATQFHPEFLTRPGKPSPPFLGLIMAAAKLDLDKESIRARLQRIQLEVSYDVFTTPPLSPLPKVISCGPCLVLFFSK